MTGQPYIYSAVCRLPGGKGWRRLSSCCGGQIGLGHGFGIFGSVERIIRVLLAQLAQQILREGILLFTARGKGKHNFGEWPEITAVFRRLGDLLHAKLFVAVNSTKPEREAGTSALRSNNVIGDAGRDVRVGR